MTTLISDHFIRTLPIIGDSLHTMRVAMVGMPIANPLVEYLAACGIGRWLLGSTSLSADQQTIAQLRVRLQEQHGHALTLELNLLPLHAWVAALHEQRPDLVVAIGDQPTLAIALRAASDAAIPALLCVPPGTGSACWAEVVFPGQRVDWPVPETSVVPDQANDWEWQAAAPLLAGLARAILLRGSPYARPDLEALWERGLYRITVGAAHPFDLDWTLPDLPPRRCVARFQTPPIRRGTLLIVGLGSIGSVAATMLAPYAAQLILADPDRVEAANPARQHYRLADLGRPKAQALQQRLTELCPQVIGLAQALLDQQQVLALIKQYGITAALIATGTHADFAIARALRACGLPHVVTRCYSRARYWEAVLVDGIYSPALDAIRGHVRYGPAPAPTPEQRAAYSDAGILEAEPATLVESGWAAAWAARLTQQLITPAGLRERWIIELLESQQTCLVGGAYVEQTADGPAYAIDLPGRIRAWGIEDIVGAV